RRFIRRRSSHARNGSLLEWTTTGPAVSYWNRSAAFFRHSEPRSVNQSCLPSLDHCGSELSATCLPAGKLIFVTLALALSHIIGSNTSLFSTKNARRLASGDHCSPRTWRFSGKSLCDFADCVSMIQTSLAFGAM